MLTSPEESLNNPVLLKIFANTHSDKAYGIFTPDVYVKIKEEAIFKQFVR